ncbi:hyalin-like [Ptychodera flava]|uniref:hyalin-like n=1 Tax=Ptychodera flava TaxID=63121 RepID=UPI00396A1220
MTGFLLGYLTGQNLGFSLAGSAEPSLQPTMDASPILMLFLLLYSADSAELADKERPSIICPVDIEQETLVGKHFAIVNWSLPNATDNSGNVTVTCSHESGTEFTIGSSEVTFNASDPYGNWYSCDFHVIVIDKEQPNITCPVDIEPRTLVGKHFAIVNWSLPNATDNSGNVTVTCSHESGTEFTIGSSEVTFNASDPYGNWYSCDFHVIVIDKEHPYITCPVDIEQRTLVGKHFAIMNWSFPNATDNSGNVTVTCSHESGTEFTIGSSKVSFNASDSYGNWYSCDFHVVVIDEEQPNITCPEDIVEETLVGKLFALVTWSYPNATDNSGYVTITCSHESGTKFKIGSSKVSYNASDPYGNWYFCDFHVIVIDKEQPNITCPDDIVEETLVGKPFAVVNWLYPNATDNSGNVTVTCSHESETEFTIGSSKVSFNASDPYGNWYSCHFHVIVIDKEQPTILCPDNMDLTTTPGEPTSIVNWTSYNATDNSGSVVVTSSYQSGMELNIGITTVTFNATDPSANRDSCHFNITVIDKEPPILTCPDDIEHNTLAGKNFAIVNLPSPNATDNSGNVTVTCSHESGTEFAIGSSKVSFNASDPYGNWYFCHFRVIVIDPEEPTVRCPGNMNITTEPRKPTSTVNWSYPNASDNSGRVTVTSNYQSGMEFTIGLTIVNLNASDPSGNMDSCHFNITVIDKEHPNIACQDDIYQETLVGKDFAIVNWPAPNATDNSGDVTVTCSHESGTEFTIGPSKVFFNASDPYGNWYSCYFQVIVIDKEQPNITCPDDIVRENMVGKPFAFVSWSYPNTTDNSGNVTVSCSHESGTKFTIGSSMVTFNASDSYGNWYSCNFNVVVIDVVRPVIMCPDNINTTTNPGQPTAVVNWMKPNATDNSGNVTVSSTYQSGAEFAINITVVEYTATDSSGNVDSCFFYVIVFDVENPEITCPDDIEQETLVGKPFAIVHWPFPNATDNSGNVSVTCSHESETEFTIGSSKVSFNASDPYGNWYSCHFHVIIIDVESPSIVCPDNIILTTNPGKPTAVVTWIQPNATDNSGNVTVNSYHQSGSRFIINMTAVKYTARDPSGNEDSCYFIITVIDIENPSIVCPDDIYVNTDFGKATAIVKWTLTNVTDNSQQAFVTSNHRPGTEFGIGSTVVNYNVSDPSGNMDACHFNVTVVDVENPMIFCPYDMKYSTEFGKATAVVRWTLPNATDNSGYVNVSGTHQSGTRFLMGLTVVSYNVSDPFGNMNSCNFTISVIDEEKPSIICPDNINTTAAPGKPTAVVNWTFPNATDNSGMMTTTGSRRSGTEFIIGHTAVHYNASDPSGNMETCHLNVTVNDIEDPSIVCPYNIIVNTDPEKPTATVNWTFPYATDNSQYVIVTSNHLSGTEFGIGSTVVNYNVRDPSGNMDSCHFNITVFDAENPRIHCPNDLKVNTDPGLPTAAVDQIFPNATDNSGHVKIMGNYQSGTDFIIGQTVVYYNASDPFGNRNSCNFTITVIDVENPEINCIDDIEQETLVGKPFAIVHWPFPNATDNSGNLGKHYSQ